MKQKFVGSVLLIVMALTTACSTYRPPESFESKMSRYKRKETDVNQVPKLELVNGNLEKVRTQRSPASLATQALKMQYSNKRLYFLTLFSQYQRLRSYIDHASPEVKSCPHFHTGLIQHHEKYDDAKSKPHNFQYVKVYRTLKDTKQKAFYPELYLPLSEEQVTPTVGDVMANSDSDHSEEIFRQAIGLHLQKTYKELVQLCDNGVSDNYYVFENLVTQFAPKLKTDPTKQVLKTLLKTTIFANMAILYSLEAQSQENPGRQIASLGPDQIYTYEVMKRLGVMWARNYFHQAYGLKRLP